MTTPTIRLATSADMAAVNDIYNHYVLHSTCTYQETPDSMAERLAWFGRHDAMHPATVAELDGEVVGWGALSPYHSRSAYRFTLEDSVYVRPGRQRQGIGAAILGDLVGRSRQVGCHAILAVIDAEQTASIGLHGRFGFVEVGRFRQIGFKFGRWLDVVYMELCHGQPAVPAPS